MHINRFSVNLVLNVQNEQREVLFDSVFLTCYRSCPPLLGEVNRVLFRNDTIDEHLQNQAAPYTTDHIQLLVW